MAQKLKNPLAQTLGLVLQQMRDKMGGVSSGEIASQLGLAASHYRMIEAGSAILQPSRAIRIVQTFDTIEFVPLCQVLVAIQILDSAKQSPSDMRTLANLLVEANPGLARVMQRFDPLWRLMESVTAGEVARRIQAEAIDKDLAEFLTTEPAGMTATDIDHFMSPTYQHPMTGQLYNKIGNILQGLAPFYLDTVLQLIDNLRNIIPRVTPEELARWEAVHKSRISYIIGVVRNPEIILDVDTFDYSFLWQDTFKKMFLMHRDPARGGKGSVHERIARMLRRKYEAERARYERELESFDQVLSDKLQIRAGAERADEIDELLHHRDVQMNNLWFYFMASGYVVPFIDDAELGKQGAPLYGTSLAYDETCEKLVRIRELCGDVGFTF